MKKWMRHFESYIKNLKAVIKTNSVGDDLVYLCKVLDDKNELQSWG